MNKRTKVVKGWAIVKEGALYETFLHKKSALYSLSVWTRSLGEGFSLARTAISYQLPLKKKKRKSPPNTRIPTNKKR